MIFLKNIFLPSKEKIYITKGKLIVYLEFFIIFLIVSFLIILPSALIETFFINRPSAIIYILLTLPSAMLVLELPKRKEWRTVRVKIRTLLLIIVLEPIVRLYIIISTIFVTMMFTVFPLILLEIFEVEWAEKLLESYFWPYFDKIS